MADDGFSGVASKWYCSVCNNSSGFGSYWNRSSRKTCGMCGGAKGKCARGDKAPSSPNPVSRGSPQSGRSGNPKTDERLVAIHAQYKKSIAALEEKIRGLEASVSAGSNDAPSSVLVADDGIAVRLANLQAERKQVAGLSYVTALVRDAMLADLDTKIEATKLERSSSLSTSQKLNAASRADDKARRSRDAALKSAETARAERVAANQRVLEADKVVEETQATFRETQRVRTAAQAEDAAAHGVKTAADDYLLCVAAYQNITETVLKHHRGDLDAERIAHYEHMRMLYGAEHVVVSGLAGENGGEDIEETQSVSASMDAEDGPIDLSSIKPPDRPDNCPLDVWETIVPEFKAAVAESAKAAINKRAPRPKRSIGDKASFRKAQRQRVAAKA